MRLLRIVITTLVLVCGSASLCWARQGGTQANAATVTGETGLFTLLSGDTLPRGTFNASLYFNRWRREFDLDDRIFGDTEESLDWNRLSASLGYGITDRWEISVVVPYDDFHFESEGDFGTDEFDLNGLNNIRIGSKYRLSGPFAGDSSRLALNLFTELPTGDDDLANDDPGFGAGLGYHRGNWVLNLGYRDPGVGDDGEEEILGGLGYVGRITDRLDWIAEVNTTVLFGAVEGAAITGSNSVDLNVGTRYRLPGNTNGVFNVGLRINAATGGLGAFIGATFGK